MDRVERFLGELNYLVPGSFLYGCRERDGFVNIDCDGAPDVRATIVATINVRTLAILHRGKRIGFLDDKYDGRLASATISYGRFRYQFETLTLSMDLIHRIRDDRMTKILQLKEEFGENESEVPVRDFTNQELIDDFVKSLPYTFTIGSKFITGKDDGKQI